MINSKSLRNIGKVNFSLKANRIRRAGLYWGLSLFITVLFVQCSKKELIKRGTDNPDVVYWSETRRLNWDDFQGTPIISDAAVSSEIVVNNPSSIERKNLFANTKISAECYFDKKSSWVDRKHATNDLLLYNQTIFDIYELYTRKLRQTFDSTGFGFQDAIKVFNELVEKNNHELLERINEFRTESKMGTDPEKVKIWAEKIMSEIQDLDEYR